MRVGFVESKQVKARISIDNPSQALHQAACLESLLEVGEQQTIAEPDAERSRKICRHA